MRLDMGELVNECLKKEPVYDLYETNEEYDSKYYEVGDKSEVNEESKIPHESLAVIYKNFLNNVAEAKSMSEKGENGVKRKRNYDTMDSTEGWTGESELSEKLMFDSTLDLDIGWHRMLLDARCMKSEGKRPELQNCESRGHNVPAGTHLIEVAAMGFFFSPVRVDVSTRNPGKIQAALTENRRGLTELVLEPLERSNTMRYENPLT
ncbi:hypothetical protein QQ045_004464 [Rhodiola kirilowii]